MDSLDTVSRPSSLGILKKYYSQVLQLDEYTKQNVSEGRFAKVLRVAGEHFGMKSLIETAYVCVNPNIFIDDDDDGLDDPSILSTGENVSHGEVVNRVLTVLLARPKPNNVLCQGYQKSESGFPEQASSALGFGIVSVYPSHRVTEVKSISWIKLFNCLGEEHMIDLLLNTSIYIGLKNDFYTQLTGAPLPNLPTLPQATYIIPDKSAQTTASKSRSRTKRKRKSNVDAPPNKKQRFSEPDDQDKSHKTPNGILFARSRMFYVRPGRSVRAKVIFGLQKKHVLNRYPDPKDQVHAKHILKYIFPRQFGLHNVFTVPTDRRETTHSCKDYTDRESEIAGASRETEDKVYRRLGAILPLITKMQKLHQQCSYHGLINYYCSAVEDERLDLDDDMSLDSIEESMELTQKEISTISTEISMEGLPPVSRETDIIRHHTPQYKVIAFIRAVIKTIIPRDLFGSEHNMSVILNGCLLGKHLTVAAEKIVSMRRFENLSLHAVLMDIKITDIPWLAPPNSTFSNKLSFTDLAKRTELLSEFIYWLFDSIIIHVVGTNFYVTETSVHRNRVFFFRHDIWREISLPSITRLKETMLEEVPTNLARLILSKRSMGFSFVRFLPKETGMRCITNLRRRTYKVDAKETRSRGKFLGPSINSILQPIFSILNLEKVVFSLSRLIQTRDPSHLGNAMFSTSDMYLKLQRYQSMRVNKGCRPLYFARVDVKSCFDTIDQDKLLEIILKVIKSDEYILHKYCEINMDQGKVRKKFNVRATATDDLAHSDGFAQERASASVHRILVEQILPTFMKRGDALDLLEEHVTNNILKVGKQYYRQKVGIPQGSVLSTILCNIFYADLEKKKLPFLIDGDGLLLRLIDDFLFISMNRDHATQFLQHMIDGHPEYGCSVNAAKSLANFNVTINSSKVPRLSGSRYFPFCGNGIDVETLDVVKDFSRMEGARVIDTLTVERTQTPGKAFVVKTLNALKLGGHAMYIDTKFNSMLTVFANVFMNFNTTAMRMHNYLRSMNYRPSDKLLKDLIEQIFQLQYTLTRSHLKAWPGSSCSVSEEHVKWLGAKAFRMALSVKQTGYKSILAWLDEIMETTNCGKLQRSMERIASRHSISKRIVY